jgi:hypothetical protein
LPARRAPRAIPPAKPTNAPAPPASIGAFGLVAAREILSAPSLMERLTVSARAAALELLRELRFEARGVLVRDLLDDDRVRLAEVWLEPWPALRRRVGVRLLVELDDVRPLLPRCGMPAPFRVHPAATGGTAD